MDELPVSFIIWGPNFGVKLEKSRFLELLVFYQTNFASLWLLPKYFFYLNSHWVYNKIPELRLHTHLTPHFIYEYCWKSVHISPCICRISEYFKVYNFSPYVGEYVTKKGIFWKCTLILHTVAKNCILLHNSYIGGEPQALDSMSYFIED